MDEMKWLFLVILFIITEAFFSGSEIAIVSCDKIRMRYKANLGSKGAKKLLELWENPENILVSTLVGTNLSVVLSTTIATYLAINYLGRGREFLVIIFIYPVILLCGEFIPKTIFQQYADTIAPKVSFPIAFFSRLLFPLIGSLKKIVDFVLLPVRRITGTGPILTKDEIKSIFRHFLKNEKSSKELEKRMIHRIFTFSETTVKEVMIPLIEVTVIGEWETVEEAIKIVAQKGYSRIPVYQERVDQIVGILYSFDLLKASSKSEPIKPLVRPAYYVPEVTPIDELLLIMRKNGIHMAIVVDEYGGAEGIVTIEDILEELVGEIRDEHDREEQPVKRISSQEYIVKAKIKIGTVREILGIDIPDGDYETLGGFLLEKFERIPQQGEKWEDEKFIFVVYKGTSRSIEDVYIKIKS